MNVANQERPVKEFARTIKREETKCATIRRTAKKFKGMSRTQLEDVLAGPGLRFNRNTVRTQIYIARHKS